MIYLINETSIEQDAPSELSAIEYYHVELATHELIYAEGAVVESYDGENRENFSNFVHINALRRLSCCALPVCGFGEEGA